MFHDEAYLTLINIAYWQLGTQKLNYCINWANRAGRLFYKNTMYFKEQGISSWSNRDGVFSNNLSWHLSRKNIVWRILSLNYANDLFDLTSISSIHTEMKFPSVPRCNKVILQWARQLRERKYSNDILTQEWEEICIQSKIMQHFE